MNPPATVRWNLDKQYLAELAEAGVPVTPTSFVQPGSAATFPAGDFVVKPAVGAGSRDAAWYGRTSTRPRWRTSPGCTHPAKSSWFSRY